MTQAGQNFAWMKKIARKLHWYIHSTFPNITVSPHSDDRLYFRESDQKNNVDTRVPSDEDLRVSVVWGVEIFGPAEVKGLYRQLHALGWASSAQYGMRRSATEWIKEMRTYGYGGNFNLGLVHRPNEVGFLSGYTGPVPKKAQYLLVNIVQISPTVTCVLVGFVLEEESSKAYELELITNRQTYHRPVYGKFTYETLGVDIQKRESIDTSRSELRDMTINWFGKHLRGFFHATSNAVRLPTAELITTKREILLKGYGEAVEETKWANLLIPYGWNDVWTSAQYNGLRLRHGNFGGASPFHTIVTLQTEHLPASDFESRGGQSRQAIAFLYHELLGMNLCKTAAMAMLQEISKTLSDSRENLQTNARSYKEVLAAVERIKSFFDQSLGIPVTVSDLYNRSKEARGYSWNFHNFKSASRVQGEADAVLAETMRLNEKQLTERVLVEEAVTREHFEQIASILSTREGVKTQRRMEYLTYISIFFAISSLIISISPDTWLAVKGCIQRTIVR